MTHADQSLVSVTLSRTGLIDLWLNKLRDGDDSARDALIEHSCERLRVLTHRMLADDAAVRRWEETDDVLQNTLLRLHRALREVKPERARDFIMFAAEQIRRELIDLFRRHYGKKGIGANHATDAVSGHSETPGKADPADDTYNPASLAEWTEFHTGIDRLPEQEREVFHLLWYEGLTQSKAAEILGVCRETVNHRWRVACLLLYRSRQGEPPNARV